MTTALPPASASSPHSFVQRVIGALRLDAATYEEVEHDPSALGQSAGVVAAAGVAAAIGSAGQGGGAIGAMLGSLLGWVLSTLFIWVVGVYFMKHTSDYKELLRTIGFASAPQLLLVVRGVPVLGPIIAIVATLWGLAAFVIAVRQALDVETGRAILVCVLALLVNIACIVGLALLFGGLLAGSGSGPGAVGF
jgi:hypothetical protein